MMHVFDFPLSPSQQSACAESKLDQLGQRVESITVLHQVSLVLVRAAMLNYEGSATGNILLSSSHAFMVQKLKHTD